MPSSGQHPIHHSNSCSTQASWLPLRFGESIPCVSGYNEEDQIFAVAFNSAGAKTIIVKPNTSIVKQR
jgi:hypothetical protein